MDPNSTASLVARKEMIRAKRKRSKSVAAAPPPPPPPPASMDIEALIATLADDTIVDPTTAATTQVHYYIPPPPEPYVPTAAASRGEGVLPQHCGGGEPRLLLRQSYRVANQADAVVGVESCRDYRASIYLVNNQTSITLTYEDLLSLSSASVSKAIHKFFHDSIQFPTIYLDSVLVEPNGAAISICNYQLQPNQRLRGVDSCILRQTSTVALQQTGWSAFKKHFSCVESYYNICADCSPIVRSLVSRYSEYLTKHYKARSMLLSNTTRDSDLTQHIKTDLPLFLQELDERRLPAETSNSLDHNPMRYTAMMGWIDAEVRRYCAPNVTDSVVDNLVYLSKW